ncbi:hypothetical protein KR222_000667, partial [Zaprionus bogoriensis]
MEEQSGQPLSMSTRTSATIIVATEVAAVAAVAAAGVGTASSSGADGGTEERPGVSGMHLLLMCLDTERHVTFQEGVVDNEGMNRRKSKCCCIYRKPHAFGESSSSSDDECEHCCGHPEVRLRNRLKKQQKQLAKRCGCCCNH